MSKKTSHNLTAWVQLAVHPFGGRPFHLAQKTGGERIEWRTPQ